jgi:hypothetical protein
VRLSRARFQFSSNALRRDEAHCSTIRRAVGGNSPEMIFPSEIRIKAFALP